MSKPTGKAFPAFISAVILFLFLDPYFMWDLYKNSPLYPFLGVLMFFLFLLNSDTKTKNRGGLFAIYTLLLVLSTLYEDLNLFGIIGTLCILFVPFAKEEFANKTFNSFLTIYVVVISVSAIVWMLSLVGLVHPTGYIAPLNELKEHNYFVYPMLVRPDQYIGLIRFERFCGPFDEPGVIGTISALVLTVGKFNFKDRRYLIVFIVSMFTLSLFYFAIVFIYFFVYTLTVSKDKKSGLFILVLLSFLVIISLSNESMYETVWSRLIWDEDLGTFAGDNRLKDSSRKLFEKYWGTPSIIFGTGKTTEFINLTAGNASLLDTIVQYGVVFIGLYFYLFIAYAWRYKKGFITFFLFIFVFISCVYQRPFLFQPEYIFLFSMMAITCGELLENKMEGFVYKNSKSHN